MLHLSIIRWNETKRGMASGLALNPPNLWIMEESFVTVIDVQTRRLLYYQLLQINQDTKKTILFITQTINEAVSLHNRVILLSPKLTNINEEFILDLPIERRIDFSY